MPLDPDDSPGFLLWHVTLRTVEAADAFFQSTPDSAAPLAMLRPLARRIDRWTRRAPAAGC
jgi:hypothetical protein